MGYANVVAVALAKTAATDNVNALSPPIAGERVGVVGWGGNGHLLEAYSTKPTCKPQSTMYYYYCRTHLERSAAAHHVCTLAACFSQSSEDAPLQTLLSVTTSSFFSCRACEVTCHNRTR